MRRRIGALLALLSLCAPSVAVAGSAPLPPAITWAVPAPVVEACLPATCGIVPIAQLYAPLLVPRILAAGIRVSGAGVSTFAGLTGALSSAQMIDPYVPVDGTMNVTGAFAASTTVAATQFQSSIATGTAPLTVASTTKVTNLNADTLDGVDSTGFALVGAQPPDPIVPADGTQNVTGAFAASTTIDGTTVTGSTALVSPLTTTDTVRAKTAAGNLVFQDSASNVLATVIDNGTTGAIAAPIYQASVNNGSVIIKNYLGTTALLTLSTSGGAVFGSGTPATLSNDGAGSNTFTGTGNFVVGAASGGNGLLLKSGTWQGIGISGNPKTVTAAGAWTFTGANDATVVKIVGNATQTTVPLQVFQSDGTTNVFKVTNAGKGTFGAGADFAGQVDSTSVFTGTAFDDHATATVKATPLAATGWTYDVPTGKGYFFQVNSSEVAKISSTGAITPTDSASGAASLVNVIRQAYTIDFGAFAGGGASQSSAQVMTGVAFGDACNVGVDGDITAEMNPPRAAVTSAGNIKVVIDPLTAAGTVNPASHSYTVSCIRTL